MIILEGPDGAGKTTLKGEILDNFPQMMEGIRGTENRDLLYTVTVADTYKAMTKSLIGSKNSPIRVWDRLFFSEFIYSKYMSRTCQFNGAQQHHVLEILEALHCPIVWCMPPVEKVLEMAPKEHQMASVSENIEAIYDEYAAMYSWTPSQTLWYDWTRDGDYDRVMTYIQTYVDRRKKREW